MENEFWSENFLALFDVVSCTIMLGSLVSLVVGSGSPIVPEFGFMIHDSVASGDPCPWPLYVAVGSCCV